MTLPRHRFVVYRSYPDKDSVRVGYTQAPDEAQAYAQARDMFGEGPFVLKLAKARGELTSYLQLNGFQRAQDRIGLMVYRAPCLGKRAKTELTISADRVCLYDLANRRKLIQQWELTP